ncbi:hypothetical protein HBN50_13880 [Halobacteriovorax sp. GB3]|uniref:hypothetical protein n=1 Tax=Halobacteriovorax sp. GB3 TaxID=2719615 RepID=UPI002362346A|nr:hypothetical protein [Halobacteriovorax sp. GB3]MDD0854197.1 hypothetical protein [Halobacteriovorax sp. GB3]
MLKKSVNLIYRDKDHANRAITLLEKANYEVIDWRLHEVALDRHFTGCSFIMADCLKDLTVEELSHHFKSFALIVSGQEISSTDVKKACSIPNFLNFVDIDGNQLFLEKAFDNLYNLSCVLMIEDKIDSALEVADSELTRVKRLYEKFVPMRTDSYKGIDILSKFAAGESTGGEFFDFFESERKVIVFMSKSNSYLLSSSILMQMEFLKDKTNFSAEVLSDVLKELFNEFAQAQSSSRKNLRLDVCAFCIDRVSLDVEGFIFGDYDCISKEGRSLFSSNNYEFSSTFLEAAKFQSKLERSGHYIILSPGVFANTGSEVEGRDVRSFVNEKFEQNDARSIINELFFQMKRNRKSSFLEFDATVMSLEVGGNVIVQV